MSSLLIPSTRRKALDKLLTWYKKEGRHDMPWRHTKDPYAILLSEFMLQQTTVSTVGPYYDRFLKKFPTLSSLAKSDLNDVLALWSGLGYYARARNLWAAARSIQNDFRGKVPSDVEDLVKLPGIGYYTAGAISSIAYNRPASVLDGNIIRVFMRLLAMEEDPKLKAVQVVLRKTTTDFSELAYRTQKKGTRQFKGGPRDLVLALFDLGATVCLPKNPQCLVCPVSSFCQARQHGRQEEIPGKKEKLDRPTVRRLYALLSHQGKWLMGQRPKEGLFGGLWEFVGTEVASGENPVLFLEAFLKDEVKLTTRVTEAVPAFEHQLSHKVMINRPYFCQVKGKGRVPGLPTKTTHYDRFRWVSAGSFQKMGISSITKRIINHLKTSS